MTEFSDADFSGFRAAFKGRLIDEADSEYESARSIWNGAIDRRPALIARCATPADVGAAISFARSMGLEISVRGGGHSFAGYSACDGGLMIDLSSMRQVSVDPAA